MKRNILCATLLLVLVFATQPLFAQNFEVHPYAGGVFPGHWRDSFQMKREGIYGIQAGGFFADRWQIEGNLGYMNHFQFENNSGPKSRALIWEAGPSVNFYTNLFQNVFPYLTVKVGGLTSLLGDLEDVGEARPNAANIASPGTPPVILDDGNTFFQFSYGGGLKAWNLWGPLGLRAEVRGRTMPNFFGNAMTSLETTAGLTFSWGER